jgi:broad specificity phosphatase PhoE
VNARPDEMGQAADVKLTDLGQRQAIALGSKFMVDKEKFDFVYSSTHLRAFHTAKLATKSDNILTTDELREYDAGDWTGKSRTATINDGIRLKMGYLDNSFLPPNGESLHMVERRASKFLEEDIMYNAWFQDYYTRKLATTGNIPNIAFFSHGMTIKSLLHYVMGFDKSFTWKIDIDNTSVTKLSFGRQGWRLHSINDCSHYIFITG